MAEHVKNTKRHDKLIVKLINIQGLSQTKTAEIENEMNDDTIFCITETQHKYQRTHFHENTHKKNMFVESREGQERRRTNGITQRK